MEVNRDQFAEVLQTCLDRIQNEQATIASVLESFPDYAEALRPELESALWFQSHAAAFNPRPGYVGASRRRLVNQIKTEAARNANGAHPSALDAFLSFFRQRRYALQLTIILALVVSMVLGANGVALAAQDSLPGDALYGVKLTSEQVQLALTPSRSGDARLHIQFAQRRLVELQAIILEGRYEHISDTVSRFQDEVGDALADVNNLSGRDASQAHALAESLRDVLSTQTTVMEVLSGAVPQTSRADYERLMQAARKAAAETDEILEATEIPSSGVPTLTGTPDGPAATQRPPDTSTAVAGVLPPGATSTPRPSVTPVPTTAKPPNTASSTPTPSPKPSRTVTPSSTPRPTAKAPDPTATSTSTVRPPQPTSTKRPKIVNTRKPPTKTPKDVNDPPGKNKQQKVK